MENARIQGEHLARGLARLKEQFAFIGDARGLGLMQAIEIVKPRATKDTRNKALRDRILQEAYQRGLLLLGCGENSIRFCPPLIISREQVDGALSILDDCLRAVGNPPRRRAKNHKGFFHGAAQPQPKLCDSCASLPLGGISCSSWTTKPAKQSLDCLKYWLG